MLNFSFAMPTHSKFRIFCEALPSLRFAAILQAPPKLIRRCMQDFSPRQIGDLIEVLSFYILRVRRSILRRRGKCRAYLHSENGVERGRGVPYSVEGVASRRSFLRGSLRRCGGERPETKVRENQNCP